MSYCTFIPPGELPPGWRGSISRPDAYVVRADGTEQRGGRKTLSVRSAGATADDFTILKQSIRAADYLDRRVRLSGAIRTRGVEGCAAFWLRVDAADRTPLAFDNMAKRPVAGDQDWREHELVLDVPPDAVQIALGLRFEGPGQVWVDGLAFDVVGSEVATTDMRVPAEEWETVVGPATPGAPVNLGFAWGAA